MPTIGPSNQPARVGLDRSPGDLPAAKGVDAHQPQVRIEPVQSRFQRLGAALSEMASAVSGYITRLSERAGSVEIGKPNGPIAQQARGMPRSGDAGREAFKYEQSSFAKYELTASDLVRLGQSVDQGGHGGTLKGMLTLKNGQDAAVFLKPFDGVEARNYELLARHGGDLNQFMPKIHGLATDLRGQQFLIMEDTSAGGRVKQYGDIKIAGKVPGLEGKNLIADQDEIVFTRGKEKGRFDYEQMKFGAEQAPGFMFYKDSSLIGKFGRIFNFQDSEKNLHAKLLEANQGGGGVDAHKLRALAAEINELNNALSSANVALIGGSVIIIQDEQGHFHPKLIDPAHVQYNPAQQQTFGETGAFYGSQASFDARQASNQVGLEALAAAVMRLAEPMSPAQARRDIDWAVSQVKGPLKAAIAGVAREAENPGQTARRFAELEKTIGTRIAQAGEKPGARFDQLKVDLLMCAFSSLMQDGEVNPHDVGKLFGALPTRTLQAMAPTPARAMLLDEAASLEGFMVLSGAIGARFEGLETAFMQASEAVLAQGGPETGDALHPADHQPREFAAQVVKAASLLDDLTEMTELFRRPQNLNTDTRFAELSSHLQDLAQASIVPIHAPQLSNAAFSALTRALERLGVAGLETQVSQRTSERATAAMGDYDTQMAGMVQALASDGDPAAVLAAGILLAQSFSNLADVMPLDSAGRQTQVSDALTRAARQAGLAPTSLKHADLAAAGSHLVGMGQSLGPRSEHGRQLIAVGQQLQTLPRAVADAVADASDQSRQNLLASLTRGGQASADLEDQLFGAEAVAGTGQLSRSQVRPTATALAEPLPPLPEAWATVIKDQIGVARGLPGVAMRAELLSMSPADLARHLEGPQSTEKIRAILTARNPDDSRVFSAVELGQMAAGLFDLAVPTQQPGVQFFRSASLPATFFAEVARDLDAGRLPQLGADIVNGLIGAAGTQPPAPNEFALLDAALGASLPLLAQQAAVPAPELEAFLGRVEEGMGRSLAVHHPNRQSSGDSAAARTAREITEGMLMLRVLGPLITRDAPPTTQPVGPNAKHIPQLRVFVGSVMQQVAGHRTAFGPSTRMGQTELVAGYNTVVADGSLQRLIASLVPSRPAGARLDA